MKILFINPSDAGSPPISPWPHLGLTILATQARKLAHQAYVVDYYFTPKAPSLTDLVSEMSPDLIGLTLYTAHMREARAAIKRLRELSPAPIALGGPHATLYADELAGENLGDYIFRGECDLRFAEELGQIEKGTRTVVVVAQPPDLSEINTPDFRLAFGSAAMSTYPIQLSRGCPYACSFCSVRYISTRRVRHKDLGSCLDEIERAEREYPNLRHIRIVDDCPTYDIERFKEFLRAYIRRGICKPLHIDNLRADGIDAEMLGLIKIIGVDHLCIGVESGNKRVFDMVHKGEELEGITDAARLIRRHGIRLYLCFVIGLPGSNPEAEGDSIRYARSLKPDWIYWNLYQPHKGTEAREWFEIHGKIYVEEDRSSLIGISLETSDAPCDTPDFSAEDRKKAQLTAALLTGAYWLNPRCFARYFSIIRENGLWKAFIIGLPSALRINFEKLFHKSALWARSTFQRKSGVRP